MIDILLATCNSGKFLARQLESIVTQKTDAAFRVVIRDDGSGDDTPAIAAAFAERHPGRVTVLDEVGRGGGARANFSRLLELSGAELIMFSDHDDIWMPDKVQLSLDRYRELEALYGAGTPLVVFSDVVVADGALRPVAPSGFRYQNIDPARLELRQLLLQNVPSGNTMLINRAMRDLAVPVPERAVMHDHWIALAAAAFGRFGLVTRPTLYYRQHGGNVYGAARYSLNAFRCRLRKGRRDIIARFDCNVAQAAAFLERYRGQLPPETVAMLEEFSRFRQLGFWAKRRCLLRHGIWKSGLLRNLGMLLIS